MPGGTARLASYWPLEYRFHNWNAAQGSLTACINRQSIASFAIEQLDSNLEAMADCRPFVFMPSLWHCFPVVSESSSQAMFFSSRRCPCSASSKQGECMGAKIKLVEEIINCICGISRNLPVTI